MSAIQSLITRLNKLEETVAKQAETIELLTMCTPLEAINEGLKGAEEAKKAEFVTLLKAMIDEHWSEEGAQPAVTAKSAKASKSTKKEEKAEKPKRAATNPTGPAAYNALLQEVWQQMIEEAGVQVEDPAKMAEYAKTAGVSYRDAQRETAIRQIMEQEDKEREEAEALFAGRKADAAAAKEAKKAGLKAPPATTPKPPKKGAKSTATSAAPSAAGSPKVAAKVEKKAEKKAEKPEAIAAASAAVLVAAAASAVAKTTPPSTPPAPMLANIALTIKAPVHAEPEVAPEEDEEQSEAEAFAAQLAELGMVEKTIKGKTYYYDPESHELYAKTIGIYDLGDRVGTFDPKTNKITA